MKNKNEDKNSMMLMHDICKLHRDIMRNKCEQIGLLDCYRPILICLKHNNGCTQSFIVNYTKLKAPTISLTLQKMEYAGIIERKYDDNDKRNTYIYITEKGLKIQDNILDLLIETDKEFLDCLNEDEINTLKSLLIKVINNVGEEE